MNNRRFNLQDEVNGQENRDRMGAGVFMLIFLGEGSFKDFFKGASKNQKYQ